MKKTKKTVKKRESVIREYNMGTMSKSEFFTKIRQVLRNGFRYYKPLQEALLKARRPSESSNKKLKWEFICKECQTWHPRKNIEIDHVIPCGSLKDWDDVVPFIQKLCAEDPNMYQVLCKPCHKAKTKQERETKKKENGSI